MVPIKLTAFRLSLYVLLNVFSLSANADSSAPINYASCPYIVAIPDNSPAPLYSSDCKTVYVPPPIKGVTTGSINLNEDVMKNVCPAFSMQMAVDQKKMDRLNKLIDQRDKLDVTNPNHAKAIAILDKEIEKIEADLSKIQDKYSRVEAGVARLNLNSNSNNLVDAYYKANMNLLLTNQVIFKALPTDVGYLTITGYDTKADRLYKHIHEIFVSGHPVKTEIPDYYVYKMVNNSSVQIVLGLSLACKIWKTKQDKEKEGLAVFNSDLVNMLLTEVSPNLNYSYKVQSSISYTASLDMKRTIETIMNHSKERSRFTLAEFTELTGNGTSDGSFQMEVDLGELGNRFFNEEDRQNLLGKLREEVRENLTARLVEEMARYSILELPEKNELPPLPNSPSSNRSVHLACQTRKFWGHHPGVRECSKTVIIRQNVDTQRLQEVAHLIENSNITFTDSMTIHEFVTNPGNTTF